MFLKIITNWGWTMYLHKENKELFRDIISIVSERKNVTTDIVEKDYYVTMILYLLSQKEIEVIFKGGTLVLCQDLAQNKMRSSVS